MSDLNSNVPVSIAPQNIQAIITGSGDSHGEIKYIKEGTDDKFNEKSIVYTSGTGAIFKSGIPIGKIKVSKDQTSDKFNVQFYSDFSQLKYVFAEVITKAEVKYVKEETSQNDNVSKNPFDAKLKILEDEIKIIEDTNLKFKEENETLKNNINSLNNKITNLETKIFSQEKEINQFNLDTKETEFLKMNLYYGHKCRRSFLNTKGFSVGSPEYKKCVLSKGRKD